MPWSTRFRPPIDLPDGKRLVTLDDARAFIFTLNKAAQESKEWQNAVFFLLKAADPPCSGPWIDFARIGMMQGLLRNVPRKINDTPKDKKWGKRKLRRDN